MTVFTRRAREILRLAHVEAVNLRSEAVDTGHLLLGIIEEGTGVGAVVLRNMEVDVPAARAEVEKRVPLTPRPHFANSRLPQTGDMRRVVELAVEEARSLQHSLVGSEHLLLGLIGIPESTAGRVLVALGADARRTRQGIQDILRFDVEELAPEPISARQRHGDSWLDKWTSDLVEQAAEIPASRSLQLDDAINAQMRLAMTRRHRRCIMLVGHPVLAADYVFHLSHELAHGDAPPALADLQMRKMLISHAKFGNANDLPERLLNCLGEAVSKNLTALVFEGIEHVFATRLWDSANPLGTTIGPWLRNPNSLLIATTSPDGFEKISVQQDALEDYTVLHLPPLTPSQIKTRTGFYIAHLEDHHLCEFENEAVSAAIEAACTRPEPPSQFPPQLASEILDLAAATKLMNARTVDDEARELDRQLKKTGLYIQTLLATGKYRLAGKVRSDFRLLKSDREAIEAYPVINVEDVRLAVEEMYGN
ncbi:MAG: Clp protease N-terminal domain-containing protein [Planctomycetota bacterium]